MIEHSEESTKSYWLDEKIAHKYLNIFQDLNISCNISCLVLLNEATSNPLICLKLIGYQKLLSFLDLILFLNHQQNKTKIQY